MSKRHTIQTHAGTTYVRISTRTENDSSQFSPPCLHCSFCSFHHHHNQATEAMMDSASPSSSHRTEIRVITPVLATEAISTSAATRPPATVLPYSFRVWVLLLTGMSLLSSGCRLKVRVNCSVASTRLPVMVSGAPLTDTVLGSRVVEG